MRIFICLLLIAVMYSSCRSAFPIAYNSEKAKNPDYKAYIIPKKGELIAGDAIEKKNETKLFKPTIFSINGTEFKARDIREYQDESGLYTNVDGSLTKALTGPRLHVFRKLSTSQTYTPGSSNSPGRFSTTTNEYYYVKKTGQDDYIMVSLHSINKLADWVQDNNAAYEQAELAQKYKKSIRLQRLISWGSIAGGVALILNDPQAKGTNPKDGALSYAGLGLISGGMVNIGLNMFSRRVKAARAYATAINLYNEASVKKKK